MGEEVKVDQRSDDRSARTAELLRAELDTRRHVEELLRESEQRYRKLLEVLPAYVYSVTLDNGRPVSTEHGLGAVAVTGYAPDDYARDPNLWIVMVHPDDRDLVRAFAARNTASEAAAPIEHRIIHRDGRVRWVRVTVVQRRDPHGRVVRYDGLMEDITARRQAELALRESERVKAIGTLAGGVARDFNDIINLIAGSASLIADSALPNTASKEAAARILEAARHASEQTRRLMGVAHMSETDGAFPIGAVDVSHVVGNALELAEPSLTAKKVRIAFRKPAAAFVAQANADQLLTALTHLLLNATEAMPGGGTITVDVSARRASVPRRSGGAGPRRPFVVVRVRDTGTGIPPEVRPRVFEPFVSTRASGGSFGVGLAVVRNMVVGWGGWVSVRSRTGEGTSVRLLIPNAEPAAAPAAHPAAASCTVLLADDSAVDLALMRQALERAGHRVLATDRIDQAVKVFLERQDAIQVTIVDLLMPAPGSKALVEAIFNHDSQAAVIVTSGFSREYARAELSRGAWQFLQKPVEEERLLKAVAAFDERRT